MNESFESKSDDFATRAIPVARPVHTAAPDPVPARPVNASPLMIFSPRRQVLADLVWVVVASVVIMVAKDVGLIVLYPNLSDESFRELVPPTVCAVGLVTALLVFFAVRIRGHSLASLGLRIKGLGVDLGLGVLTAISIMLCLVIGSLYVQLIFPDWAPVLDKSRQNINEVLPQMNLPMLLLMMGIVAVYEELLFRGFVLTRLRRVLGSWWLATTVAACAFGLLHLYEGPVAVVFIMFLAVVLSLVFIWRKSLTACIVAHFIFNVVQIQMIQYVSEASS